MPNTIPVTKCPQCGSNAIELAAFTKAHGHDLLTCPGCGGRFTKDQFVAELLGKAAKILQDALRNIPGFKAK